MSATAGFTLTWLRLSGVGRQPARVDFYPGLNVFWGASDTGKSLIYHCVNFLLGAEKLPKQVPELSGYSTAELGLIDRTGKRWIFERSLRGGDIIARQADGEGWIPVSELVLGAKHDANRTDTVSHMLLAMIGLDGAKILASKKSGKTRSLSYRDVAHVTLIQEARIIAEGSPVYPTGQYTKVTEELSTFSLLISGRDWSSVQEVKDNKVDAASWRGKAELFQQLIAALEAELGQSGRSRESVSALIEECDRQISEVSSKIEESSSTINRMMTERRGAWEDTQKARSRLGVIEQLRDRFHLLRKHYDSDLARLRFISEGDFLLSQLGVPHCPYCGELLEEHTAARLRQEESHLESIQVAARQEALKIALNLRDLDKTLNSLEGEQSTVGLELAARQDSYTNTEKAIRQQLEPQIKEDKQRLAELVDERVRLMAQQLTLDRLAQMNAWRVALGDEPKQSRASVGLSAEPDAASLRDFCDVVAELLVSWRYSRACIVELAGDKDMVVNGKPRANHGKGVGAFLHAAFTVGLMKHCDTKNLKHPGVVLLDSPLTSYKEKDREQVAEDIQYGFYEGLLKLPDYEQVIIFENKEPPKGLQAAMRHTHFTGNPGVGRQGFIPLQTASQL